MAGTAILVHVNSFSGNIFGSASASTATDSGDSVATPTTVLPASFKAIDGKGNVIEDNGVTKSDGITVRGYSDSEYDPGLQCSIDSFYIYCNDGSEVAFQAFMLENIHLL